MYRYFRMNASVCLSTWRYIHKYITFANCIIASIKMDIMGFMIMCIKLHSICLSLFTYILGLHIYVAR